MAVPFRVPWFIMNLSDFQIITSPTVPSDISDQKGVVLAEQSIPGLNYQPVMPGGGENRKISMELQIVRRDNVSGNVTLIKQFERLRNRSPGLRGWRSSRFSPVPKVLYYWGTGSLPLVYWVSRMNFTHQQNWVNAYGMPQVSTVDMELTLDEAHPLYQAEEMFRLVMGVGGEVLQAQEIEQLINMQGVPY